MTLRKRMDENINENELEVIDGELNEQKESTEKGLKAKIRKNKDKIKKVAIGVGCAVGGAVAAAGVIGISVLKSFVDRSSEETEDEDEDDEETENDDDEIEEEETEE